MIHPEWALKHKQKGAELRCIRGKYYLYSVSSKWDPDKKRARKVTGPMIGTITEKDGLIPRGERRGLSGTKTRKVTLSPSTRISAKEYGATSILRKVASDIVGRLQESFADNWIDIVSLSMNRLLHQSPLKNMEYLYQESYISEEYQNLDLSKNKLTSLLQNLGEERSKVASFMSKFIDGSEHLVFDTTHVTSCSRGVTMSEIGYNSAGSFEPQTNLFYVFSTDKQMPVYYRLFPGNISGMSALKLCIKESGVTNAIAIGDKGFCSEENMGALEESDLNYILPLKRNNKDISYERLESRDYDKAFDGHFFYRDRPIFYYTIDEDKDAVGARQKKIVVFYDKNLAIEEDSAYLRRIESKIPGYDMTGYKNKQFSFGTMSMITNMSDLVPQKIYENYKSRMEVETVFDTYKNLLDADRTYMHSDKSMQGWMFINHISLLMYYAIFKKLKEADLLSKVSVNDILLRLSKISKLKIGEQWYLSEINSKTTKILDKLGWHIT